MLDTPSISESEIHAFTYTHTHTNELYVILSGYILILYDFFFLSLYAKSVSPEDSEKKRTNYQAYRSFLNREGPKALGSKEIPKVRP